MHPLNCRVGATTAGDGIRMIWWTFLARVYLSGNQTSRGSLLALDAVAVANMTHQRGDAASH